MQVERFKELELERYKLLERDRVNKDFNKKLSDYETEYRQRLDGLHRREVESARAIDKLVSFSPTCILTSCFQHAHTVLLYTETPIVGPVIFRTM